MDSTRIVASLPTSHARSGRPGESDPLWSPINGEFDQLPPSLIQCASGELLRCDAERLAEALAQAGRPVRLQIWENQVHDWLLAYDVLPEARRVLTRIGDFVSGLMATSGLEQAAS